MSDLISRKELLKRTIYNPCHAPYIVEQDVIECPTAKSKIGKWIRITQDVGIRPHQYMCSECHRIIEYSSSESPELLEIKYPYCHCGAKMERRE